MVKAGALEAWVDAWMDAWKDEEEGLFRERARRAGEGGMSRLGHKRASVHHSTCRAELYAITSCLIPRLIRRYSSTISTVLRRLSRPSPWGCNGVASATGHTSSRHFHHWPFGPSCMPAAPFQALSSTTSPVNPRQAGVSLIRGKLGWMAIRLLRQAGVSGDPGNADGSWRDEKR
jgi:hypothetical protein